MGIFAGLAIALSTSTAQGGYIYQFQSSCIYNCVNFGLTDFDELSGTISIFDSAIIPNSIINSSDVESFSFSFGTFAIDETTAANFSFDGTLDGTSSFSSFSFTASEGLSSSAPGETLRFLLNDPVYPVDQGSFGPGFCNTVCSTSSVFMLPGSANLSNKMSLVTIPEPNTLWLIALGLICLISMKSRYKFSYFLKR